MRERILAILKGAGAPMLEADLLARLVTDLESIIEYCGALGDLNDAVASGGRVMSGKRNLALVMLGKVATLAATAATPTQLRRNAALRLLRARQELGLTQEQVAGVCGVDRLTVWRRENAKCDLGALEQLVALEAIATGRKAA